jgi:hypothetical protein
MILASRPTRDFRSAMLFDFKNLHQTKLLKISGFDNDDSEGYILSFLSGYVTAIDKEIVTAIKAKTDGMLY